MNGLDGVRPGHYKILIAAFEVCPTKILLGEVHLLKACAGGPVKHQDRSFRAV